MTWTSGYPTIGGYYWFKDSRYKAPIIVLCYPMKNDGSAGGHHMHVTNFKNDWSPQKDGMYYGPLVVPPIL